MPIEPDQPGGSNDPTRANDPIDPTRAQDPVDPTRAQDPVDPTLAQPVAGARYEDTARTAAPLTREPLRREPDGDDRKGAWWLWALLAAVLIAIVLFALLSQGDDDDDAVGTADQTETEAGAVETVPEDTAIEDTTIEDTAPEAPAETTPDTTATTEAADGGDAGDGGTVTAEDGTDLFTVIQGDAGDAERLAPYADQDVQGQGVEVLDVVEGEGFWIGTSDQQQIFAHAPADTAAEVQVGQRITFDGFLEVNPPADSADVHDIPQDQGAELHRQQGHHVELRSLTPA